MAEVILGVSADFHDSAAALLIDGELVAAVEEERFSRRKHDPSLPVASIRWCLDEFGIGRDDLDAVAFASKPFTTYERVLATHAIAGPRGFPSLSRAVGVWSKSKLWVGARLATTLEELGRVAPPVVYVEHHESHAASAFYPSPFESAAVVTMDGVGEWTTTSIGHGRGNRLDLRAELRFPDSAGLLYSAATAYCGFEVNDGEYKLMGLAPYGEPRFADVIRDRLVDIAPDGSIRIDQRWFDYRAGRRMYRRSLDALFDGSPRRPDQPLTAREADLAASFQVVLEDIVLATVRHARDVTGERNVCLAGGVALNCVANARLRAASADGDVWVQPAAGDAGGAVGAALWQWHRLREQPRLPDARSDVMAGTFLGPAYPSDDIAAWLTSTGVPFEQFESLDDVAAATAAALDDGAIVGWFQGRMEFGPRALGHRSIVADPRDPAVISRLNLAVKRREGFRPFAPAVLEERVGEWFATDHLSPYMLFTAPVAAGQRRDADDAPTVPADDFAARLGAARSTITACTHVDQSARYQTVGATNPEFRTLIEAFDRRTGCPVLVNTSFNRRDEPIVRTPADAFRCFLDTDLDLLVLERCLIRRSSLPEGVA